MQASAENQQVRLDPWSASSLLQKGIRRGETEYALIAAHSLYRFRGKGVFRRLINICFEDIGIADPNLVSEVTFLALTPKAREAIGSDLEVLSDLVRQMAAAAKDRSTDYLICATLRSPEGKAQLERLNFLTSKELIAIAIDCTQSLMKRAAASLIACSVGDCIQTGKSFEAMLEALSARHPSQLYNAVEMAARAKVGAYILMAPLLWSELCRSHVDISHATIDLPPWQEFYNVPLLTFDKHTAIGKGAIAEWASSAPTLAPLLTAGVDGRNRAAVACMAAFYAEAIHVAKRLVWSSSEMLQHSGLHADMAYAGCSPETAPEVVAAAVADLPLLNQLRIRSLLRNRRLN